MNTLQMNRTDASLAALSPWELFLYIFPPRCVTSAAVCLCVCLELVHPLVHQSPEAVIKSSLAKAPPPPCPPPQVLCCNACFQGKPHLLPYSCFHNFFSPPPLSSLCFCLLHTQPPFYLLCLHALPKLIALGRGGAHAHIDTIASSLE